MPFHHLLRCSLLDVMLQICDGQYFKLITLGFFPISNFIWSWYLWRNAQNLFVMPFKGSQVMCWKCEVFYLFIGILWKLWKTGLGICSSQNPPIKPRITFSQVLPPDFLCLMWHYFQLCNFRMKNCPSRQMIIGLQDIGHQRDKHFHMSISCWYTILLTFITGVRLLPKFS